MIRRMRLLVMVVMLLVLISPLRSCASLLPPESPANVGRRPPGLTEVYPYSDGIEVQVTDVWAGRRLGVPMVELTVILLNGSNHTFEAWMSGDLRYGSYQIPAVRYSSYPWPEDSGSMQVIAIGEYSFPYMMTFVIPEGSLDEIVFALAIDAGTHDPAVFVGGI